MLAPAQEISPRYLRTLRQTLREIILPEVTSPAARNAAALCDFVFLRMITALEELPAIQDKFQPIYAGLVADAARLIGAAAPADQPVWEQAKAVQASVPRLFERLAAAPDKAEEILALLAAIGRAEADFRQDYEAACARAAGKSEPMPRALLVNSEAVQRHLDARFPGAGISITSCYQIPGGRSKLTVLLSVTPNDAVPEDMVIRIDGPGSAIDTTVLDEFPVLDSMYKAGIVAPEPLWMEEDSSYLGAPFLVMRRMPGAAAGDLWGAEKVSPAIGLALAEALASVHGASVTAIWPGTPPKARDAVQQMLDRFEGGWRKGDSTPSIGMECSYGWLRQHLPSIDGPTVVVHGDAHFANLLALDDKLVCLLDWEFTHPGHPAEDLAYCRGYVETIMAWPDFMAHYRAHGGPEVTEAQLQFFGVWGYLRNITMGANMLRDFAADKVHGIQNLAISLNTRAKLEALLSKTVAAGLGRDAEGASR